MPEERPPTAPADEYYSGLGSVPMKREPASSKTGDLTGVRLVQEGAHSETPAPKIEVTAPTPQRPFTKPLFIGLCAAVAALVALSGYVLLSQNERQQIDYDAKTVATTAEPTEQSLASDLIKRQDQLANLQKEQEDNLVKRGNEPDSAGPTQEEKNEEIAKEIERAKELQASTDAANEAVEEKERLEKKLAELESDKQRIAEEKAKFEKESQRLSLELADRKPAAKASIHKNDSLNAKTASSLPESKNPKIIKEREKDRPIPWVKLGRYETGENKGRWYFVAPDGYVSPLYFSREQAISEAEYRAGLR